MARRPLSTSKQLLALLDKFSPSIRSAFLAAISDIRSATVLQRVIDAIELGDVTAAFQALGFSQAAMRPLTAMIEQAFERGGVLTADAFPRLGVTKAVFRFDVRNSRAEAWLRDHSSTLVTNIGEDIRLSIRNIMTLGVADGRNPRNIGLDIIGRIDPTTGKRTGGVVGLTGQQSTWVGNARRELSSPATASNWFGRKLRDKRFDRIVQNSISTGVPLDADTVARLTSRYSDSLLRMRGETIGRTEALQSLNHASDEAFRQAVDGGLIRPEAVQREWDATGNDGRTRETHLAMDGQVRGLDEPFASPSGARMMFPGDFSLGAPPEEIINCRCVIKHRVDFLAGVNDNPPAPPMPTPAPPVIIPTRTITPTAPIPIPTPAPPIPGAIPLRPITSIEPIPIPVPPIPARETFAYENFKPLPTVAAAETWMKENIGKTIALTKGVKIDGLNTIAHSIQEVNERFSLPPIRYIGDPKKDTIKWRDSRNATASFGMQYDAFLFKNVATDAAKQTEQAAYGISQRGKQLELAKSAIAGNRFIDAEVRERITKMDGWDWSVSPDPRRVTYHEMGHRLHSLDRAAIDQIMRMAQPRRKGWGYLLSRYGSSNDFEYVAESFSLYMQGDPRQFYRIHPTLLDYFKMRDRARSSN